MNRKILIAAALVLAALAVPLKTASADRGWHGGWGWRGGHNQGWGGSWGPRYGWGGFRGGFAVYGAPYFVPYGYYASYPYYYPSYGYGYRRYYYPRRVHYRSHRHYYRSASCRCCCY